MRMSIKLTCDDEQNYGFEKLEEEGNASERFMMRAFKPRYRMKRQLTLEDIELLIY